MNFDYKNGQYDMLPTLDKCVQAISRRFDAAQHEINYLKKDIENLKSEHYKDEQLKILAEENNEMKTAIRRGFSLTEKELESANDWIKNHNDSIHGGSHHGAIGGAYDWIFTPTGIGTIGEVRCSICNEGFRFMEL